jgi:hypothetical protein
MIRLLLLLLLLSPALAQDAKQDDMTNCPMHQKHMSHQELVHSHGEQSMGFSQDATTHHFRLLSDGGAIEVTVNSASDTPDLQAIRSHLSNIARVFSNGDFSSPTFVHDGVPPGVSTMKLLRKSIRYTYEDSPSGGRVRLQSWDPIAVAAIHDFLRFQITEHQTGDALEANKE